MSAQWTQATFQDTLRQLVARAATDVEFRHLCLEDGRAALREISGLDLPEGAKVRFVEQLDELVVPLPPEEGELSDKELEAVAGGWWQRTTWLVWRGGW